MTDQERFRNSKFLSLSLHHEPERVGLKLSDAGWVGLDELLRAVNPRARSAVLVDPKVYVGLYFIGRTS